MSVVAQGAIIESPCTSCGASGRVQEKREVTVTIPEGIYKCIFLLRVACCDPEVYLLHCKLNLLYAPFERNGMTSLLLQLPHCKFAHFFGTYLTRITLNVLGYDI